MANSTFILRAELINPDNDDYTLLHEKLAAVSFFRVMAGEHWLDLPTGTYVTNTSNNLNLTQDAEQVENQVAGLLFNFIAQKPLNNHGLTKDYCYILSKFDFGGYKLNDNTDPSKIPS
ncbi:MAG: hypothetical protein JWP37_2299 [Mucilaginibacter sp.]|nr:hypothetical protein [Mucilaginibacter sp.]